MRKGIASLFSVLVLSVLICNNYVQAASPIYRNVKDYGATGNGNTDDSQAIITALTQGRADNPGATYPNAVYSSSTQHPAYVYFPAGTYLVTQTLPVVYYTQMVGDPNNLPVIKFVNNNEVRVLEVAGGWYHGANQDNFYRQIRNFVIDMTACGRCTGVHWQVAQATSISNVYFKAAVGSQAQGMWMENGSGGWLSDLVFEGGIYGMWVGNQQFTTRNVTIRNVSRAGIYLNWDWIWTFKSVNIFNAPVGIEVAQGIGSLLLLDSHFTNVTTGISTTFTPSSGVNSLVIENVKFDSSKSPVTVVSNRGNAALTVNAGQTVKGYAQGHIWRNQANINTIGTIDLSTYLPDRPAGLSPGGKFFEAPRPNWRDTVDVTTLGVTGDGSDITAKLQAALNNNAGKNALFFPHGTYLITDTVTVPPGSRLVGQVWSVLMAGGNGFRTGNQPKPMLRVGTAGQTGVAQFADFMISTQGPQPNAVLIEWNLHDPPNAPGSNALWDVHYRIGGAIGTQMQPGQCPRGNGAGAPASACTGAWALLHVTSSGNIYMENVWGWVADHDIDQGSQVNIYNARGFLIESQGPTWLYGTASEHNLYYQYNFYGAKNIFMGAIQTETPYFQPSTQTPWNPNAATDPSFCTGNAKCNMSLGLVINNSNNIYLYSGGLYSFFDVWSQDCLKGTPNCQDNMVSITNSKQIYLFDLSTYGSTNILTTKETYSVAAQNNNTFCSTVAVDMLLF